ncbi:MAG TPA: hypothetical protein VGL93_07290 [Streptosporangiaceae bacterium]
MTFPAVQPPPGALVIRRAEAEERRADRALGRKVVRESVFFGVCLAATAAIGWTGFVVSKTLFFMAAAPLICAVAAVVALWRSQRARSTGRRLGGLELWLSPEGVAYVGAAGFFPAPWAAVRAISFHAEALVVDVRGWGGPLAELAPHGEPCSVRMPLAGTGVDRPTIGYAVRQMTGGRVTVGAG